MDTAIKKANKGLAALPDGEARKVQLAKARKGRRVEDKKVIADGVAYMRETKFIPVGSRIVYCDEEVAALEAAKLLQDWYEIERARMNREWDERSAEMSLDELYDEFYSID